MTQTLTFRTAEFAFRLDSLSGVPVFRQLIDQVLGGVATGVLRAGQQLPTVRQVAVDLAINPNTVMRAYREMEIRGIVDTQQGTGTFIAEQKTPPPSDERARQMAQLVGDFVARAGALGFSLAELMERLQEIEQGAQLNRRNP
jgi:GntR family transcriptional regulator